MFCCNNWSVALNRLFRRLSLFNLSFWDPYLYIRLRLLPFIILLSLSTLAVSYAESISNHTSPRMIIFIITAKFHQNCESYVQYKRKDHEKHEAYNKYVCLTDPNLSDCSLLCLGYLIFASLTIEESLAYTVAINTTSCFIQTVWGRF